MKSNVILKLFYLFIGMGMTFFIESCTYDEIIPKEVVVPDSVSFVTDIIPIFNSNCNNSGCHNTNGIPPDLSADKAWISITFFGYLNTAEPENSLLYTKINTGSMKINATDQHRALILKWIEQGAQDN